MSAHLDSLSQAVGYESYDDYLKSRHWRSFSKLVRRRECHCCCMREYGLTVHHVTYDRLGRERVDDVVTLCISCHSAVHDLVRNGKSLSTAHTELKRDLVEERRSRLAALAEARQRKSILM